MKAFVITCFVLCVATSRAAEPWPRQQWDVDGWRIEPVGDVDGDGFGDHADTFGRVLFLGDGTLPSWGLGEHDWGDYDARGYRQGIVAAAGDVDGDGYADFALAMQRVDPNEGAAVLVFHGAEGGVRVHPPDLAASPWIDVDPTPNSDFGWAMEAGDLDGDGFSDLAIAAPSRRRVVVHRGGPFGLEAREWWVLEDVGVAGITMADVNGDGRSDLIVVGDDLSLYLGAPSSMANAPDAYTLAAPVGARVVSAGDVDADGFADLALAGDDATALMIVFGARDVTALRVESVELPSPIARTPFFADYSRDLAALGDLNGDGFPDLAVALETGDFVYVLGASTIDAMAQRVGGQGNVHGIGDVDDDGYADLDDGHGHVVLGGPTLVGEDSATELPGGDFFACAGDVDGDGTGDLLMRSAAQVAGCAGCGESTLVFGGRALRASAWRIAGAAGDELGFETRGVGDVDGDGYDEIVVGNSLADPLGRTDAGWARLFWGSATGPVTASATRAAWVVNGAQDGTGLGLATALVGDVNGDGRAELVVGAGRGINVVDTTVYSNRPAGWQTLAQWSSPYSIGHARFSLLTGAGDLDRDGHADLAMIGHAEGATSDTLFVRRGGAFELGEVVPIQVPRTITRAAAGDIDGDGHADLALLLDDAERLSVHVLFGGDSAVRGATQTVDFAASGFDALGLHAVGDVDGDGFAEVVAIGRADAPGGRREAVLYRGSVNGLVPAHALTESVGDGCDLDGDGFADLPTHRDGQLSVYYGNGALGTRSAFAPRVGARQPNSTERLAPGGVSRSPTSFAVHALGRSPWGPERVRLVVEVKPFDAPFDGRDLVYGPWAFAPSGTTADLTTDVTGLLAARAYRWRARIDYDTSRAHPTTHSRWYSGGGVHSRSQVHVRMRSNTPIVALEDRYVLTSGALLVPEPGVLANDRDPDGDRLTVRKLTEAKHGEVTLGADGGLIYRPLDEDFTEDSFVYEVSDGLGQTATAVVHVTVPTPCDVDLCLRGDYFAAVRTRAGELRSVHCWVEADGAARCDLDESGALRLGEPMCGR